MDIICLSLEEAMKIKCHLSAPVFYNQGACESSLESVTESSYMFVEYRSAHKTMYGELESCSMHGVKKF